MVWMMEFFVVENIITTWFRDFFSVSLIIKVLLAIKNIGLVAKVAYSEFCRLFILQKHSWLTCFHGIMFTESILCSLHICYLTSIT